MRLLHSESAIQADPCSLYLPQSIIRAMLDAPAAAQEAFDIVAEIIRMTPKEEDFVDRAVAMQDPDCEQFKDIAFWARIFVQASMPHSDPGSDRHLWGRQNGAFQLTMKSGSKFDKNGNEVNIGLPYGSIPRLLMSFLCTEAVRTKTPQIFLGDSLSEFMKAVGIGPATGGRWGSITRLKNQMERLFEAQITYRWETDAAKQRKSMQIADEEVIWWSPRLPNQPALFKSHITLSDAFYKEITDRPVPIKLEALRLLKQSPLALDLYTFLTHRVFALNKPLHISWSTLARQLGAEYGRLDNFSYKCKQFLRQIQIVYPDLKVETPRGRLLIKPSPTHVIAMPSRRKKTRKS